MSPHLPGLSPLCGNVSPTREETVSIPFAPVSLWWVMGTKDLQWEEKPVRSRSCQKSRGSQGSVGFAGKVSHAVSPRGGTWSRAMRAGPASAAPTASHQERCVGQNRAGTGTWPATSPLSPGLQLVCQAPCHSLNFSAGSQRVALWSRASRALCLGLHSAPCCFGSGICPPCLHAPFPPPGVNPTLQTHSALLCSSLWLWATDGSSPLLPPVIWSKFPTWNILFILWAWLRCPPL